MRRISYLVSAGRKHGPHSNYGSRGWWNRAPFDNGSTSNFVRCKTKAHAMRQFARVTKGAQIDVRGDGKPYVWRWK